MLKLFHNFWWENKKRSHVGAKNVNPLIFMMAHSKYLCLIIHSSDVINLMIKIPDHCCHRVPMRWDGIRYTRADNKISTFNENVFFLCFSRFFLSFLYVYNYNSLQLNFSFFVAIHFTYKTNEQRQIIYGSYKSWFLLLISFNRLYCIIFIIPSQFPLHIHTYSYIPLKRAISFNFFNFFITNNFYFNRSITKPTKISIYYFLFSHVHFFCSLRTCEKKNFFTEIKNK